MNCYLRMHLLEFIIYFGTVFESCVKLLFSKENPAVKTGGQKCLKAMKDHFTT